MHWIDWVLIGIYMVLVLFMGLYFKRRASGSIEAFFISGRALPWYVAGISLLATSFASDTPLWITSLVRQHGMHFAWQFWAPAIGSALTVVLFARMWRRLGVLTDPEMIELRYSGNSAAVLRFWNGLSGAVFFCPLIIGWVVKAMEIITTEAMGIPEDTQFRVWSTVGVLLVAVIACALSGLWGVVYTDFIQFIFATIGTLVLASVAVHKVGGLNVLVSTLHTMSDWPGNKLTITPRIGTAMGYMPIWIGFAFFVLLWPQVALSGGYNAQRLLACKNPRSATHAMLLHTLLYYGVIAWPWIIVALCSLILIPELGDNISHDHAYPRMIVDLMPVGLRGILVVALLSAFMSTISTLFNWGSSYMVNDVYKRFIMSDRSQHHYVNVGRILTCMLAVTGGVISFYAKDIQQLLTIAYVLGSGGVVVGFMRWFWWRLNAAGEIAAAITGWTLAPLLLFVKIFDEPYQLLFNSSAMFSSDADLLGARMLFMVIVVTFAAVVVSLLTKPVPSDRLKAFVTIARPIPLGWNPIIRQLGDQAGHYDGLGRVLVSWAIVSVCVLSLLVGLGSLLLGDTLIGTIAMLLFLISLLLTLRRINQDVM